MKRYRPPSFPPLGPWDDRMFAPACTGLEPVETVHSNDWFCVRNRGGYYTVEYHHTHVTVLPIVDARSVLMVRVKRPVLADAPLEFPGGTGPASEDPVAIAARELAEETGIAIRDPQRFRPMPPIAISSTRMPRLAYLYRVEVTREELDSRADHDAEVEALVEIPLERLDPLVASGEIYVSVPLAIIARLRALRANER